MSTVILTPETMTPKELERDLRDKARLMDDAGEGLWPTPMRIREWADAVEALRKRLEEAHKTIDAMMRECGSEPNSRYARNACIIGAAALAAPKGG